MSKLQALIHDGRIDPLLLSPADGDGDLSAVQQIGKNPDVDTGSEDLIDGGATLTVPTQARVHALVSSSANDTGGKGATGTITITDYAQMLASAARGVFTIVDSDKMTGIQATGSIAVVDYTKAVAAAATGTITVVSYAQLKAASATGTLTIVDYADLAGAVITVGSDVLTEGVDFDAETSNAVTATNLAAAIDALTDYGAAAVGAVVTVTVVATGTAGNSLTLSSSDNDVTVVGFSGGRAATTLTVAGHALVADSDFNAETDNATTAENIKTAVHALTEVNATRSGSVVTVTAASTGTSGNSLGLVTSNVAGATVSGATLTGGQTALAIVVGSNTLTAGSEFTAATSNAATATSLASAIDGLSGFSASATGSTVTITADIAAAGGDEGNKTLTTNNTAAATVSGATLTGGRSRTTLTVDNDTYVAETDFDVDVNDDAITARNLAEAINDAEEGYTASVVGDVVTIVDDDEDESGNSSDLLTSNSAAVTAGAATLAGGEDLATITVNGVAFVAGVDFTPETSHAVTAANLAAAINASEDVLIDGILTASVSGAVITITAVAVGTGGNSITLATDDSDSSSVSGATLSGGRAHGTGARNVYIEGLSSTGAVISETVILNGTSSVNTVNSYKRINKMEVTTVGSGGVAAGNITATAATDSTVTIRVLAGNNRAFSGFYTVPTGYTLYVVGIHGAFLSGSGGVGTVALQTRASGAGWVEQASTTFNVLLETEHEKRLSPAVKVPAGYDVKLVGTTNTDNSVMRGQMDAVLVAD